jgi:aspartate/methionine/tyrosine aminotransferase
MVTTAKASALRTSQRLSDVGFSDIVQIRNKVMALRETGRSVYQFEGGEPFLDTDAAVKDAMTAALAANKTRYAPSSGIPDLRKAIAEKLRARNGFDVTHEDVLVTVGGMQALFAAFQTVLDPGDEVLLFSPYWTPIKDLVSACQAHCVYVGTERAKEEGIGKFLGRYLTPKTRAIYYNTPQNPSGIVFSRRDAEAVAAFAQEHDLIVIADEAYEDLVYDGEHFSIAALPGMMERTLTCFTLSKSYAMTGWRVGYVVAKEPFMTGMKKMVLYTTNGVSTPSQWAALEAMRTPLETLRARREEYRKRRDLLIQGLNEVGLSCAPPAGAFYAFPDVVGIHSNSREAANILLERASVATVPGVVFGPEGEGHCRFSFSRSIEQIEEGLASLRKHLR